MTSRCIDQRFEKQLYAYELGILEGTEREELELHLLDCAHCFARVEKFAPVTGLMRNSRAVRDLVARQGTENLPGETRNNETGRTKTTRLTMVRISILAAAVLIFLILKPWQFEFHPTHEVVAAENRLAVLRFDNLTRPDDPDRLGNIVSRLLITDLSESNFIQVVSSQPIQDIERLMGDTSNLSITSDRVIEVARRSSARWLLTGDIYEAAEGLRVSMQLIDVGTGVALASLELTGSPGESVFALVDRLSAAVRESLPLPEPAHSAVDRSVAEATTESAEAYRHYVEGLELEGKYYYPEAAQAFERAVACDSTFAMAYYHLATLKDQKYLSKAIEYAGKTSWIEQRYIQALQALDQQKFAKMLGFLHEILSRYPDEKEACFRLGDYYWQLIDLDSAIVYYHRALDIDPLYRNAWNNLAYTYSEREDLDRAIEAINKYIDLAPDEANPYDSRGDLYAFNGNPEQAAQSYLRALVIKPDYWTSAIKLAAMRVYQGRYQEADSIYDRLEAVDRISTRTLARLYRPTILLRQGRLDAGLTAIDSAILAVKQDFDANGQAGGRPSFFELKARIYAEQGRFVQALAELDTAIDVHRQSRPTDSVTYLYLYAQYLAEGGDFSGAEAISLRLSNHTASIGEVPCYQYWSMGGIELARHNPAAAVRALEKAAALGGMTSSFPTYYLLARAYLESGDLGRAVPLLERLPKIYAGDRLLNIIDMVKLHYYLGIAYEESRWYDRAAEEYRTFLEIWKDADSGLTEVEDARQRLARLRS